MSFPRLATVLAVSAAVVCGCGDTDDPVPPPPPGPEPVVSFAITTTDPSDNATVSLSFTATDPQDDVDRYLIVEDDSTTPTIADFSGAPTSPPGTFDITGGEGQHTLYAWVIDLEENISARRSDVITVDTVDPGAPGTPTDTASTGLTATFTWDPASDATSGVASYYLQVGTTAGGSDVVDQNVGDVLTYDEIGFARETLYARVFAVDAAGNEGTYSGNSDGVLLSGQLLVNAGVNKSPGPVVMAQVTLEDGVGVLDDATVTVNSTGIPLKAAATGVYELGGLSIADGADVELDVTYGTRHINLTLVMPEAAVITAPTTGTYDAGAQLAVTWNAFATAPGLITVAVADDAHTVSGPPGYRAVIVGSATSHVIPANTLKTGTSGIQIIVAPTNRTSSLGPDAAAGSQFGVGNAALSDTFNTAAP